MSIEIAQPDHRVALFQKTLSASFRFGELQELGGLRETVTDANSGVTQVSVT